MAKEVYDVIVVLGGGINLDGTLTEPLRKRVDIAIKHFKEHRAKSIIMAGAYSYKSEVVPQKTEALAMKEYAEEQDVPSRAVLLEDDSKDTIGNLYYVKTKYLIPQNWKRVLVVIAPNHSEERIEYTLNKVWGAAFGFDLAECSENSNPKNVEHEKKALELVKSFLDTIENGDHEGVLKVMRENHPAYSPSARYSIQQIKEALGET